MILRVSFSHGFFNSLLGRLDQGRAGSCQSFPILVKQCSGRAAIVYAQDSESVMEAEVGIEPPVFFKTLLAMSRQRNDFSHQSVGVRRKVRSEQFCRRIFPRNSLV